MSCAMWLRRSLPVFVLGYLVFDAFVLGNALGGEHLCTTDHPSGGPILAAVLTVLSFELLVPGIAHADGMPSGLDFDVILVLATCLAYFWCRFAKPSHLGFWTVFACTAATLASVCLLGVVTSTTRNCF